MIRKIYHKLKLADRSFFVSLVRVFYFNLIKINRFIIFEWNLTQEIEKAPDISTDFEIKILNYKEIGMFIKNWDFLPREFYMHEIDGVINCVAAIKNGQIVYICWIYLEGDRNRFFNLKAGEAHFDYAFTFREYRRFGLNAQSHLKAAEWLKGLNIKRALIGVHEDTIYMLRSLEKIRNIKRIGTLTHWFIYRPKFKC